jgi:hypothetical protein
VKVSAPAPVSVLCPPNGAFQLIFRQTVTAVCAEFVRSGSMFRFFSPGSVTRGVAATVSEPGGL